MEKELLKDKTTFRYVASGLVYGRYWSGGEGSYKAKNLENNSKRKLLEEAKEKVKSGALDSGMGYETVLGAILELTTIATIMIGGKEFTHKDSEIVFVGELTETQQDFLIEVMEEG